MLVKIESDLFYIGERLKEIDDGYYICFNTRCTRFEIHNSKQPKTTFCLVVPKNKLSPSLVEFVRKTRMNHQYKIIKEIDENNRRLDEEKEKQILERSAFELEKTLKNEKRRY